MASSDTVRIDGMDELRAALKALPEKMRKRALRNALGAGGRVVRDYARRVVPVISPADPMVLKGYRRPGTVKRALSVRTSKLARRRGDIGVFINVRPLKKGLGGAKVPNDPFYWRWLEFGRKGMTPRPFLRPAVEALTAALDAFKRSLGPAIAKLNTPRGDA